MCFSNVPPPHTHNNYDSLFYILFVVHALLKLKIIFVDIINGNFAVFSPLFFLVGRW